MTDIRKLRNSTFQMSAVERIIIVFLNNVSSFWIPQLHNGLSATIIYNAASELPYCYLLTLAKEIQVEK